MSALVMGRFTEAPKPICLIVTEEIMPSQELQSVHPKLNLQLVVVRVGNLAKKLKKIILQISLP